MRLKMNKILIILCALLLMATAASAMSYQVFYKDMNDARVKLLGVWPEAVFNVKLGNVELGDLGVMEFDRAADLSQALGSAYSTVEAVYLHSPATDFFDLNRIVKTKNVWIMSVDTGYEVFYKDMNDTRVKLLGVWPEAVFNVKLGNVELGDLGVMEFDRAADLSQALGSAYSTVEAVYLHSPATDFFDLNRTVKTKNVWVRAVPPAVEEPTQEEIIEEVEEVTGTDVPPEAAQEVIEEATGTDVPPEAAQEVIEEVIDAIEEATGTDVPPEAAQEVIEEATDAIEEVIEASRPSSPLSVLAKLLVMEKAVQKARKTEPYLANKNTMEPLLKDIEKQIDKLKSLIKGKLKTRLTQIAKAKGTTVKKQGFFSRMFNPTGKFFTGMAINLKALFKDTAATTPATPAPTRALVPSPPLAGSQAKTAKAPTAKGIWQAMENQLKQLKESPVFKANTKAQVAITKINGDVAKLKSIAEGKPVATPKKANTTR